MRKPEYTGYKFNGYKVYISDDGYTILDGIFIQDIKDFKQYVNTKIMLSNFKKR